MHTNLTVGIPTTGPVLIQQHKLSTGIRSCTWYGNMSFWLQLSTKSPTLHIMMIVPAQKRWYKKTLRYAIGDNLNYLSISIVSYL